ncbi:MAG TPA: hypothetical protein VK483_15370 [Chitinophagaceae bacterium]|nr:hypothetical protein [Chitinophagaceae bacterium]
MKKNIFYTVIIALVIAFFLSGCVEPRFYRTSTHRSERYEHRHHMTHYSGTSSYHQN